MSLQVTVTIAEIVSMVVLDGVYNNFEEKTSLSENLVVFRQDLILQMARIYLFVYLIKTNKIKPLKCQAS